MTPKEKAKDLVKKYSCLARGEAYKKWIDKDIVFDYYDCQNALILCDELIESWEEDLYINCGSSRYWKEVKEEIDKL
jgi:hypothetical protein